MARRNVTATVVELFPRSVDHAPTLHLSDAEVRQASGGYRRAADQLKALHARGFVRAYIPRVGKKRVILERAHHDAVVRGQFGAATLASNDPTPPAPRGNRAALVRLNSQKARK
jgi:hypothetical protein